MSISKTSVESSPPNPKPLPTPLTTVSLTKRTAWEIDISVAPGEFISELDFIQIIRLLQHNRIIFRQKSAIAAMSRPRPEQPVSSSSL